MLRERSNQGIEHRLDADAALRRRALSVPVLERLGELPVERFAPLPHRLGQSCIFRRQSCQLVPAEQLEPRPIHEGRIGCVALDLGAKAGRERLRGDHPARKPQGHPNALGARTSRLPEIVALHRARRLLDLGQCLRRRFREEPLEGFRETRQPGLEAASQDIAQGRIAGEMKLVQQHIGAIQEGPRRIQRRAPNHPGGRLRPAASVLRSYPAIPGESLQSHGRRRQLAGGLVSPGRHGGEYHPAHEADGERIQAASGG